MELSQSILEVQNHIALAEKQCGRALGSVKLLAVSKGQSKDKILTAYHQGLNAFGENYLQEALDKINTLSNLPIEWHFLGPIQSNKAANIAEYFSWVHSVDRIKIAKKLSCHRPHHLPPLNICLQVNIDTKKKAGVASDQLSNLAEAILKLPYLKLRGLMAIPAPGLDPSQLYETYHQIQHLQQGLNKEFNITLDTLSLGMSDDFEIAIAAGSTLVRIGRYLFGERHV